MFESLLAPWRRTVPPQRPEAPRAPQNKQAALEKALDYQIHYYKKWARLYQGKARTYKRVTVGLGGLVTVLLGLDVAGLPVADALPQVAFLLSALLTGVANMEGFQDPKGETVRFHGVYLKLLQLRARYYYEMAPSLREERAAADRDAEDDATIEKYWNELQAVLADAHAQRIEALDKRMQHKDA